VGPGGIDPLKEETGSREEAQTMGRRYFDPYYRRGQSSSRWVFGRRGLHCAAPTNRRVWGAAKKRQAGGSAFKGRLVYRGGARSMATRPCRCLSRNLRKTSPRAERVSGRGGY